MISLNKFSFSLLYIFIFLQTAIIAEEKIIYMIAMPRSSSTAFLRMMHARGDFAVMNEPSLYVFCKKYNPSSAKSAFTSNAKETHAEVITEVLERAKRQSVFVKDMGFFSPGDFIHDVDFMRRSNVHFVFLVRNPHNSIISFYNVFQTVIDSFSDCIGCKASYEIYQSVKKMGANPPLIIFSEDLYDYPQETVERFCHQLNIPFKEEFLHWKNLGENFSGFEEWNEIKLPSKLKQWHSTAIQSEGFQPARKNNVDSNGCPTFIEIENLQDRKKCQEAYKENVIFYQKFIDEAKSIQKY